MANRPLDGLEVAIPVTDGFEQVELLGPRRVLDEAGADTRVSPKPDRVRSLWVDEPAVVDGHLVSSRKPDDLPALTAR